VIGRAHALGRSFKKLVAYLKTGKDGRQRQRDRVDWVEFRNLPTRNPDTAACMMAATASESMSGTREPVYHFSVSCDPGDPVDLVNGADGDQFLARIKQLLENFPEEA
jgi:hypothetical protein